MKVLIEGYYYDPAVLEREQVTDGLIEYHRRPSDGYVCYNYVGHVYSPMLKDYIFFPAQGGAGGKGNGWR